VFELFSLSQIVHHLLDLVLLELKSFVAGVNLYFKVFNILDELKDFFVFVFQSDVKLDDHVFEAMFFID